MASQRLFAFLFCTALVASTVIVYFTVFSCGFVTFDDPGYVSQNRQVLSGLSLAGWNYAWTTWDCTNWHPLTWLSLELDGSLWGKKPAGFHATNLILHILNSLLLFLVLNRMTNATGSSAFVAALFALHPLHVESVAWISERKDVLSTFFLLLTVNAYIGYAAKPSIVRYLQVFLLFALGLLAKPMLVTLPILLLLLDWWPLRRFELAKESSTEKPSRLRTIRRLIIEKLPLFVIAFFDGLMTIVAQKNAARVLNDLTLPTRIGNAINAYVWYLQKTFAPTNLIVFYPHPQGGLSLATVAIDAVILVGISFAVFWFANRKPHLVVGWLWFLISLLPVIGLLQVGGQAYADRYSYVPHIGLFVAIVWELKSWFPDRQPVRTAVQLGAVAVLVVCGILTHQQLRYWKSSLALWNRALEVVPDNGVAHAHLSDVLFEAGDYEGVIHHIERGMQLTNSGYVANGYCNWGRALIALNRPKEAEEKFWLALKADKNHDGTLGELSNLLMKQGRKEEAKALAARHAQVMIASAEKEPNNAAAQFRLGVLKARQGNLAGSMVHFERAVQLAPDSAPAHHNLALALMQMNRLKEAKSHFLKAIEFDPRLATARVGLGDLLEREKDFAGAKKQYLMALEINPTDKETKQRLERISSP